MAAELNGGVPVAVVNGNAAALIVGSEIDAALAVGFAEGEVAADEQVVGLAFVGGVAEVDDGLTGGGRKHGEHGAAFEGTESDDLLVFFVPKVEFARAFALAEEDEGATAGRADLEVGEAWAEAGFFGKGAGGGDAEEAAQGGEFGFQGVDFGTEIGFGRYAHGAGIGAGGGVGEGKSGME